MPTTSSEFDLFTRFGEQFETQPTKGNLELCAGCAGEQSGSLCWDLPPCSDYQRPDHINVIWIKKEKKDEDQVSGATPAP